MQNSSSTKRQETEVIGGQGTFSESRSSSLSLLFHTLVLQFSQLLLYAKTLSPASMSVYGWAGL
jgi:hypothetical protein